MTLTLPLIWEVQLKALQVVLDTSSPSLNHYDEHSQIAWTKNERPFILDLRLESLSQFEASRQGDGGGLVSAVKLGLMSLLFGEGALVGLRLAVKAAAVLFSRGVVRKIDES